MSAFTDEYERQLREGLKAADEALFPPAAMELFRKSSEADIAAGNNLCLPCGAKTMHRVFGLGHPAHSAWLCKACGDRMWAKGKLHGTVHFDMTKEVQP